MNGNEQQSLVDIGRQDMTLLRKIRRFADNIVSSIFDGRDKSRSFLIEDELNAVAHGHGIGASNAFQPEVSFDFAFDDGTLVGFHRIPTARIFDNKSVHCKNKE